MSIFRRGRSRPDRVTVRQAEPAPRAVHPPLSTPAARAAAGLPVTDPHGANGALT
ncbi:hypothetical protein [Streptomyces sp. NWU339]|uniref:hypothetical protein n=1 Tax=Streptomyces sp. NWU339 TaxID=2185284 RepID=UPI0015E7F5D1|nr:hypothetical protein [Streptomyces sp. NWU339]